MIYVIVTVILIISSVLYLKVADKFNIIDKPNQRSSHTIPVIRGGGVLFVLAIVIFYIIHQQYLYFFLGTLLIATVSFVDDLKTLSSRIRLPFQLIAIWLLLFQVYGLNISCLMIFLMSVVGLGCINFYNFMDGINGITGLFSFVVLFSLYYINLNTQILNPDLYCYQFIGITVFGFYNFRKKARFFAGDIGSILLILKENVGQPHRHHLYQKLVDVKRFSHLKVAILYCLLQLIINIVVVGFYQESVTNQWTFIGVLALCWGV